MGEVTERADATSGLGLLAATATAYGLYALYMLVEMLDFLALLHSPEPGYHPTFDAVAPVFLLVEAVVCACLCVAFLLLGLGRRGGWAIASACLALTAVRAGFIYFLYYHDMHEEQLAPFIHKLANAFSPVARTLFPAAQVVLGLASAWACRRGRATAGA